MVLFTTRHLFTKKYISENSPLQIYENPEVFVEDFEKSERNVF